MLVAGGRLDLPPCEEDALRETVGAWYPNVDFAFAADFGHYVMLQEPVFTAAAIEPSSGPGACVVRTSCRDCLSAALGGRCAARTMFRDRPLLAPSRRNCRPLQLISF
jgi:hypothetical protein